MKDTNNEDNIIKHLDRIASSINENCDSKNFERVLLDVTARELNQIYRGRKHFTINIIETRSPFIMSIYPEIDSLSRKMTDICNIMDDLKHENILKKLSDISQLLNSVDKWVIEIDKRIITKPNILAVECGEEFVALLCHEIGHTRKSQLNLLLTFAKNRFKFSTMERLMLANSDIFKSILLLLLSAHKAFGFVLKPAKNTLSLIEEIDCDESVPLKYKFHLYKYIEKGISNTPLRSTFIVTAKDVEDANAQAVEFSRDIIYTLTVRKNFLKHQLSTQAITSESPYYKKIVEFIANKLMGINLSKNTIDRKESSVEKIINARYLTELAKAQKTADKILESMHVTSKDIDLLKVQALNIETNDEKYYILYTIYDYIEALEKQKNKILKKTDKSIMYNKIDAQIKELESLKSSVISSKVNDNGLNWGIFIKYPAGYENRNDQIK